MASPAAKEATIVVPKLNLKTVKIKLVGDSPLICHAWSEKAKKEMLDKQMKKAKNAKEAKSPEKDFEDSLYYYDPETRLPLKRAQWSEIPEAKRRYGFPTNAVKACAVDACSFVANVTKVEARGAFHIDGELVEVHGKPKMREDMVRIAMGTADIRFRGEFDPWFMEFTLKYNANILSPEQFVNLYDNAGFSVGLGEWRPQKDGPNGRFHSELVGEGK